MVRWVSGDAAGRICFFDCSRGSRVVRPYIPSRSSNGSSSYYQKLLQSQCSCLTFSGGWGGYDEEEVTMGTSEGGVFAVASQWPSAAAASAAEAADASKTNTSASGSYFDFPQAEGEAQVLRCASLPYCVLLVQMLGVHTPELRRLLHFSEAAAAGTTDATYSALTDAVCCRNPCSSSRCTSNSSCCSSPTRLGDLFGSDRQLLAVDKGGNGIVLDWCRSSSNSTYEAAELRRFSLKEPLCCCSSNSLLVQQLAVASATAASFLSVYDIEAGSFCFYAHAPPAAAAAQAILCCSRSTSTSGQLGCSTRAVDSAGATASTRRGSSTRVPVYAEVASPWPRRGTFETAGGDAISSNNSSKLQQQVCTSVSWLPRLGPSILCGVTADALLLLYDTRASSFPVYITSTAGARSDAKTAGGAQGSFTQDTSQERRGARPMVFVGSQPGLVAPHDEMEAAILPCCCSCCRCTACKRQRRELQRQGRKQQDGQPIQPPEVRPESLFEGHRGCLVLKPHSTPRRKPRSSGNTHRSRLSLLSSKLTRRITEEFDALAEEQRQKFASSSSRTGSSAAIPAAGKAPASPEKSGSRATETEASRSTTSSSNNSTWSTKQPTGRDSWAAALVSLSSFSDSPLTSFPALSRATESPPQHQQTNLLGEVLGWLATACYALVASSLSLLLTEKHLVRRQLMQHAQQQLLLLLRSSCLPPEALQPSSASAAAVSAGSKIRGNSAINGCSSVEPSAAAGTAASTRPSKKARVKGAAAAGRAAASAATAVAEGTGGDDVKTEPVTRHHDVLQKFADQVLRLAQVLEPTDSSGNCSGRREQQQKVQEQLPLLLHKQRENVLRLLEYCAAFSFCFSQSFLGSSSLAMQASPRSAEAAMQQLNPMQQSELPVLLLQQAAKEVLRRFRRLVPSKGKVNSVAAAANGFVSSLQMGFALTSQQPHLLFSMLACWLQQQQQKQQQMLNSPSLLHQPGDTGAAEADDSTSGKEVQQQKHGAAEAVVIPEVYIQRNCICRLPISDSLYFSIARQQRSRRNRSNTTPYDECQSSSNCGGGVCVDTASLICCDTAGEISVLRVTVHRFRNQREKHLYIQHSRKAAEKDTLKTPRQEDDDPLTVWFPRLPELSLEEFTGEENGISAEAYTSGQASLGKDGDSVTDCSCRCCCSSYSVRLEMNFLAPRSSTSSSNLAVHSNGSYVLLASRDPYFALYGINRNLPPYGSCSRAKVAPLLGLALPPFAAAPLKQQQHAAAEVVQPLLLSAAPLLPSVPLPTSVPPYLAAPPIPSTQVCLQRRFHQQLLQQQQTAGAATAASLGGAAWDTGIEFADWLSEPEEPEWQPSDGE